MSTSLYERIVSYDYGTPESNDLNIKVWKPTPWVVNVFTDGCATDRDMNIRAWCHDNFGPESSPIHGINGDWHRGGATVHGETWFGFATKELMDMFIDKWGIIDEEATR